MRWLLGLLLCLVTPPAQDLIVNVVAAVTGAATGACCFDECDESGTCTQQCAGCVCGARVAVAPAEVLVSPAPAAHRLGLLDEALGTGLIGHIEPPFRPPAV